jgi:hypothetical protein
MLSEDGHCLIETAVVNLLLDFDDRVGFSASAAELVVPLEHH